MNDEFDPPLRSKIEHLRELKKKAILGGGEDRIAEQRAKGKLTAHEGLNLLLDEGSFIETDPFAVCTPLLTLEALKMQNEIVSHKVGRVASIMVQEGATVKKDSVLLEIKQSRSL